MPVELLPLSPTRLMPTWPLLATTSFSTATPGTKSELLSTGSTLGEPGTGSPLAVRAPEETRMPFWLALLTVSSTTSV